MNDCYKFHHGIRLRRILKHKKIIIRHYAKKVGLTPPWLYDNFEKAQIKEDRLTKLLAAIPLTMEDFYHWDSLTADKSLHQGERVFIYLEENKLKVKKVAESLGISVSELYEWGGQQTLSAMQLLALQTSIQFDPAYFNRPQTTEPEINWKEAFLDKRMELQQCHREIRSLKKKLKVS